MSRCIRRTPQFIVAIGLFCALASFGIETQARGESWEEARAAHDAEKYTEAIKHYEALVDAGIRHEALFYNLGNAYFRLGKFGPAVFNYERALRVDPQLSDARHNARLARAAVAEQRETRVLAAESVRVHALARGRMEALLLRGAEVSRLGVANVAFLVMSVAFFVGLVVVRYIARGFVHATLIVVNVFTGIGFVASAFVFAAHVHAAGLSVGVVLPPDTALHAAPSSDSRESGNAYAGLRVRILARDSGWLNVRLAGGTEGWIAAKEIGELR